jgi:hypothetical protein
LEHQDYPFPLLIDELQVLREPSRSPLFDVVFELQKLHRLEDAAELFALHESGTQKELGGLMLEPYAIEQRFARFDLEVQLIEGDQELFGTALYNTDLFAAGTIAQLVEHWQEILEAAVNGPQERLSTLSAVVPVQRLSLEVISVFTAEPLEESLSYWMDRSSIPVRIRFAPYNQVFQELLDPTGGGEAVKIILLRLEDWASSGSDSDANFVRKLERNVSDFLDVFKTATSRQKSSFVVCLCPESDALSTNSTRIASLRNQENLIRQTIESLSDVYLIDYHDVIGMYDVDEVNDPTADEVGHIPYTPDFFTALGTAIARQILFPQLRPDPEDKTERRIVVNVAREMQRGRIPLPAFVR